jgi:hypothetical protein
MNKVNLIDERMHDGSRHFVYLPETATPIRLLFHVFSLFGAYPTAYVPSIFESWIDFRYRGQKFSINNQYGDFWFFVQNPECPEEILNRVAAHFAKLLSPSNGL